MNSILTGSPNAELQWAPPYPISNASILMAASPANCATSILLLMAGATSSNSGLPTTWHSWTTKQWRGARHQMDGYGNLFAESRDTPSRNLCIRLARIVFIIGHVWASSLRGNIGRRTFCGVLWLHLFLAVPAFAHHAASLNRASCNANT
jgi:hypothetical protein